MEEALARSIWNNINQGKTGTKLERLRLWTMGGSESGVVTVSHADGTIVRTVAHKRALFAQGGAAVDMESHVVARVATAQGLPFAIARCISDPAGRTLPPAIAVAMRPDGGVDVGAVLRSLVAEPAQIAALLATGMGFARAMRSLERGAVAIGPALASLA